MHDTGHNPHPEAWQAWLDTYGPTLVLYARQWLRCHADAEDAVQDGFVRFWRRRHLAKNPVALAYTCVRSAALDHIRCETRRKTREQRVALDHTGHEPPLFAKQIESEEEAGMIQAALSHLSIDQREAVVLKVWGGLTFAEIAEVLQINANTAASRYRLALQTLRQTLSEEAVR